MDVSGCLEGKNIFLTGGSGFMGKALIEKILRTVPNVGNIYVLLRAKKGKSPQERITDIFNDKLYDTLKKTNPSVFEKVKCIEGDVLELKLGINDNDRKILTDNVDIIYNFAASVKFDDPLRYAILVNVRSTRELIELAKEAKHLKAFIHVSTAYCNADKNDIDEQLYPSHGNWREAIKLAEEYDSYTLDVLTQKFIHPLPNTYTYAKSLSEHTVYDLCYGQIPAAIVRPTIVLNTKSNPIPGWTDNLNGPVGLFFFGGTGLMRVVYGNGETYLDNVPVDVCVKVVILITCRRILNQNLNDVDIYNNSKTEGSEFSIQEQMNISLQIIWSISSVHMYWYPFSCITKCKYHYYLGVLLFHVIPAILIDFLLWISRKQPMLLKIQRKVYIANMVLHLFMSKSWNFHNKNTVSLESKISIKDLPEYSFKNDLIMTLEEVKQYMIDSHMYIDSLLFKDKMNIETSRKRVRFFWILDKICSILSYGLLVWLLWKSNIFGIVWNSIMNYVTNL